MSNEVNKNNSLADADREKVRLVSGFSDIFVFIGLALFFWSTVNFISNFGLPLISLIVAILSWGLSEVFTKRLNMAFPSIVLLIIFTLSAFLGFFTYLYNDDYIFNAKPFDAQAIINLLSKHWNALFATLLVFFATSIHYLRFRVPITISVLATIFVFIVFILLAIFNIEIVIKYGMWISLILGMSIFSIAMLFDSSDVKRETRRADIAFWLHLIAAPMVIHSSKVLFFGTGEGFDHSQSIAVVFLFFVLAIIALLIDRRAILVASLGYAAAAFRKIFVLSSGINPNFPASIFVLGVTILILSAGWHPIRKLLLSITPASIKTKLPS